MEIGQIAPPPQLLVCHSNLPSSVQHSNSAAVVRAIPSSLRSHNSSETLLRLPLYPQLVGIHSPRLKQRPADNPSLQISTDLYNRTRTCCPSWDGAPAQSRKQTHQVPTTNPPRNKMKPLKRPHQDPPNRQRN